MNEAYNEVQSYKKIFNNDRIAASNPYGYSSQSNLFPDLVSIRNSTVWISIIPMLVGISCLILFSYRSTKPIKRMRYLVNSDRSNALGWDEWVDFTLNLAKDIGKLNSVLKKNQKELQIKWLHDAINGYLLDNHLQSRFYTHFMNWNQNEYQLSVISIDDYRTWLIKYNESDQNLIKYALVNVIEEFYSQFANAVCLDSEKDHFIVFYQSSGEKMSRESSERVHNELIQTIKSLIQISVSVGIGESLLSIFIRSQGNSEMRLIVIMYILKKRFDVCKLVILLNI